MWCKTHVVKMAEKNDNGVSTIPSIVNVQVQCEQVQCEQVQSHRHSEMLTQGGNANVRTL